MKQHQELEQTRMPIIDPSLDDLEGKHVVPDGLSPVSQMFQGRSVFITGVTGFLGRVLLEKLLRTYRGIKHVYVLLRAKKNLSPSQRLYEHVINIPIFDRMRSTKAGQDLLDKLVVIEGDIGQQHLGISKSDMSMLWEDESLSIVFHSAATIKFDEPLKTSIQLNLVATKSVIELCKRLKNLVCLCHVSSAFVNSHLKDGQPIEERLYPMDQEPAHLISLAELMDENRMQTLMKANLVGERPNTYTYTKAMAEHLIANEASHLPVAIVRPSIVVSAWKEPLEGWIDNINGPTGLIIAIGKGILRTMYMRRDVKADIIPVDVAVNTMIAAGYYAHKTFQEDQKKSHACNTIQLPREGDSAIVSQEHGTVINESQVASRGLIREPRIFHCTSGDTNPITWGQMEDMFFEFTRIYPSKQVLRYPMGSSKQSRLHDSITRLFVHYMPALIIDLLCIIMGKRGRLLSIYHKLHSAVEALSHFTTTNYHFKSDNCKLLLEALDERDKRSLNMDIKQLDWHQFTDRYVLGARRFVLKETDDTLDEARRLFRK